MVWCEAFAFTTVHQIATYLFLVDGISIFYFTAEIHRGGYFLSRCFPSQNTSLFLTHHNKSIQAQHSNKHKLFLFVHRERQERQLPLETVFGCIIEFTTTTISSSHLHSNNTLHIHLHHHHHLQHLPTPPIKNLNDGTFPLIGKLVANRNGFFFG